MNKTKIAVGILLIFTIGVLAGTLGTGMFVKRKILKFALEAESPPKRVLKRFTRELDLSNRQQIAVEEILSRLQSRMDEFNRTHHPDFRKIFNDSISQLRDILDERQQRKLDRLYARLKHRTRRFSERPPGRHPPNGLRPKRDRMVGQMAADIIDQLHLNQDQAAEVRRIIREYFGATPGFRKNKSYKPTL